MTRLIEDRCLDWTHSDDCDLGNARNLLDECSATIRRLRAALLEIRVRASPRVVPTADGEVCVRWPAKRLEIGIEGHPDGARLSFVAVVDNDYREYDDARDAIDWLNTFDANGCLIQGIDREPK